MSKNFLKTLTLSLAIFLVSFAFIAIAEWKGPEGETPPDMPQIKTPLNVGPEEQTKSGALSIGGVFEADQGIRVNPGGTLPNCDAISGPENRGIISYETGTTDRLVFCQATEEEGVYEWKSF